VEHDSGARVDLLVGGVQDRGVAFWMEHGYLARHSEEREIRATFGAAPLRGLVATRELLIALKLQPFRLVDRRDIFALCFEPRDSTRMKGHLDYVQAPLLAKRFRQMPAIVRERAFEDSFKGLYRIASPRWIGRLTRNLDALVRDAASDD